jgi:hypothetical protein
LIGSICAWYRSIDGNDPYCEVNNAKSRKTADSSDSSALRFQWGKALADHAFDFRRTEFPDMARKIAAPQSSVLEVLERG